MTCEKDVVRWRSEYETTENEKTASEPNATGREPPCAVLRCTLKVAVKYGFVVECLT